MDWGAVWDIGGCSGIDGCRLIGVRKVRIPRPRYEHTTGLKRSVAHSVLLEVGHSLRVRKIHGAPPKATIEELFCGEAPREKCSSTNTSAASWTSCCKQRRLQYHLCSLGHEASFLMGKGQEI